MVREPESAEECAYFSNRAADAEGNKFIIWVFKDAPTVMNIRYICGKCRHQGMVTSEYALPYTVCCEKCSSRLKVEPLKGKAKGAKKKKK